MRFCVVLLKDECVALPTGVGHNSRLDGMFPVVVPSDILMEDAEFCRLSHGYPSPSHGTFHLHVGRVRSWPEAPHFDVKPFAARHENRDCEFCGLTIDHFVLKLRSHV